MDANLLALFPALGMQQPHAAAGLNPQIVGSLDPQIVGASLMAAELPSDSDFYDEFLPLSGESGESIAAGATADFELKPTQLSRPGHLFLPSGIASNLLMLNLSIGGHNVFKRSGAIPCGMFTHDSTFRLLYSATASNSVPITFTLKNIHATDAQIVWGCWGVKTVKTD